MSQEPSVNELLGMPESNDTLKLSVEKHELDAEEANKTLAKVQAEAAAMRKNVHEVVKEFRKLEAMEGNEPIRCSRIHFGDWADRLLEPTAGRELLDEMRRKDERIAELEKRSAEWETWYLDMQDRAKRKSRTAKAALSEAREQIAEQSPLVEAARELREMLQGTVVRNGGSKGVDWTVIDGKSIASTIIKLRDAKGGDECA